MGNPRLLHTQQLHYYRKAYDWDDLTSGTAKVFCTVPAGSIIVDAFALVTTAFDSVTSDLLDMGTSADPNGFMTAVSVATVGKKSADELATSDDLYVATDTDLSFTWTQSGGSTSAGSLIACVLYIPNNDG